MRNSYDPIAEQWHASSQEQTYVDRVLRYVDTILGMLPPKAKILDVGCGTGRPIAEYLVQRGFRLVGVDGSKKMLEIARRVVPEAKLIYGDMVDVNLTDTFAAAIAWDSIFHVERRRHSTVISQTC